MDDSKFRNEPGQRPRRNELCPCGSGSKFKKCHGDVVKKQAAFAVAKQAYENELTRLIYESVVARARRNEEKTV